MIADVVPGGLDAFRRMEEPKKTFWRERTIDKIGKDSAESGKVAVVAGHFMFWSENDKQPPPVMTSNDREIYTHILYLDVPVKTIAERRLHDNTKKREAESETHLNNWQQDELTQLRFLCRKHGILFSCIPSDSTLVSKVSNLLKDFRRHSVDFNLISAKSKLDEVISMGQGQLTTMLVIDADKTLTAEDTGESFWQRFPELPDVVANRHTLTQLFSSNLGYTYTAFRQAVLLYEEATSEEQFEKFCVDVASTVSMYPEMVCLLQLVVEQKHLGAVIATSGLKRIWEKVLENEGLSGKVKVIGSGRISDEIVIPAKVKGELVSHLQDKHDMSVCAIGDSPLDLDMLMKADQAILVVGEERTRSKTMDEALTSALQDRHFQAKLTQTLLPSNVVPRPNTKEIRKINLTEPKYLKKLFGNQVTHGVRQVLYPREKNAAKLLATPMRDSAVAGLALREAHRRVGWYLATEYLSHVLGLEQRSVLHVQGEKTTGYHFRHERQTTIVALMRGGEPMAFGVSDALPDAMFVHAKEADDLKHEHLQGRVTVVLVDSVINDGTTISEVVNRVRKLHATIRIVIIAGVVQARCVSDGNLNLDISRHPNLHLIALRISENKYKGTGTIDTGNRLFNTTQLK